MGILADNPDQTMPLKAFHCHIQNDVDTINAEEVKYRKMPKNKSITPLTIQNTYIEIKNDVVEIEEKEIERIKSDPNLAHLLFCQTR